MSYADSGRSRLRRALFGKYSDILLDIRPVTQPDDANIYFGLALKKIIELVSNRRQKCCSQRVKMTIVPPETERTSCFFPSTYLRQGGYVGIAVCLLHCALASCGAVYCNRSCLWVCDRGRRAGGVRTLLQPARAPCLRLFECFFHLLF